jgi:hypothetical protein
VSVPAYVEAQFPVMRTLEPPQVPLSHMVEIVTRIVATEGPIHGDEIVARVRMLWGLARAGNRIRAAVEKAVIYAVRLGALQGGPFYTFPDQSIVVRNRADVLSASLRKPEMLPPAEIEKAIFDTVSANFGAGRNDLVQAISRGFGFSATSAQLRAMIETEVDKAIASGRLAEQGDLIVIAK